MEHQKALGLGLQSGSQAENLLSTAPASPQERIHARNSDKEASTRTASHAMPPPHSTVAQLSFGPATQQTVTTVTTTTTVSLPPLVMRPPHDLYDRDPRQFPLAWTPTPAFIRKFQTNVQGQPIEFQEEEDVEGTVRRHQDLQHEIQRHNGSIQLEEKQRDDGFSVRGPKPLSKRVQNVRGSTAPKQTATPPSIAEAAELASLPNKPKKQRPQSSTVPSELSEPSLLRRQSIVDNTPGEHDPSPVTPDTDAGGNSVYTSKIGANKQGAKRKRSIPRSARPRMQEVLDDEGDPGKEDARPPGGRESHDDDSHLDPPFYAGRNKRNCTNESISSVSRQPSGAAATPPIAETDLEPDAQSAHGGRPNLPSLLTNSHQDVSLPSPSLSPITAAANLASRNQDTFDASFKAHISGEEGAESTDSTALSNGSFESQASHRHSGAQSSLHSDALQTTPAQASGAPNLLDIPSMVGTFDAMPEALQTYVMYQLLRRCSKPTLQMVATTVNPALKCDPFHVLPAELGLNITRFLDFQSMCRAAQVSKRWRKMINTDEKAWKDLLDRDGFSLPDGEIARAVKEGWGWQNPGEEGYEQDLSRRAVKQTPEPAPVSPGTTTIISDDEEEAASSTVATRTKRKSLVKHTNSKKLKRRAVQVSSSATKPSGSASRYAKLVASAQGPNGLATAATQAVPHPSVGLPSLKSMHLFKSLYQRHHLMKKAWMMSDSQPQHLAFRAHHRHVVTCLLFDDEKILTGSDDTKINVYDTKTGALRNRLEGHEGGVWALQYEGDTLVSGSTDRSVRVWDIKSGKCLQVFQGHTSTVRCLVILKPVQIGVEKDGTPEMMPKEPLIITGSRDSTLRVWKLPQPGDRQIFQTSPAHDRDNPYFLRALTGHHNSVRAIAAHGDTLVSGSYDCTVRVWKISNGELVHRLQGHTQKVYSVVLDSERNRCISGSMDTLVKVWDLSTGGCLFNLEGHGSLVGLLDLSHDRLVSAAADSTLRIWDPEFGSCKATLTAHTGAITCFQHDGQKVISGSDRTLKMWNVRNGEFVRDLLTDLSGVWQVGFDERRCVAAVQRNNLTYIEVLDFGASRDGIPAANRGRRIVVDSRGRETDDESTTAAAAAADADGAGDDGI